jgi:fructose-1,6-bisphosphatase/inositol monophosphatase family enzyme
VIDRVTLQVGDEPGNIDNGQQDSSTGDSRACARARFRHYRPVGMSDENVLEVLRDAADAVAKALAGVHDWGLSGARPGQYRADLVANDAALAVLRRTGMGILSEETGLEGAEQPRLVVIDPLDGSTNASRGLPWFATALCVLDTDGPCAALVLHHASRRCFTATRGGGAFLDGSPIRPASCTELSDAFLGLNGLPARHYGWSQYRTMGAAALDLCAVASGVLDGYVDCVDEAHGVWDYAAAAFICHEAGASCVDALGRDLFVRDPRARRTPVAAGTGVLCDALVRARND